MTQGKMSGITWVMALVLLGCGAAAHASEARPLAFYTFEEGAGSVLHDKTGHGHHGKINGAEWTDGPYGGGLLFDGDDAVVIPEDRGFEMGTQDFTLEAWFKTSRARNNNRIVSAGYLHWEIWTSDSAFVASIGDDEKVDEGDYRIKSNSGIRVDDAVWHHGLAVFDRDDRLHLYLDGKKCDTVNISTYEDLTLTPRRLLIGAHGPSGHRGFQGVIAEVGVYRGTLSTEQAKKRYRRTALKYLY